MRRVTRASRKRQSRGLAPGVKKTGLPVLDGRPSGARDCVGIGDAVVMMAHDRQVNTSYSESDGERTIFKSAAHHMLV